MRVTFFQRKRRPNRTFSVESYFQGVREHLPKDVESQVAVSRFESRGIARRAYTILEARARQGDVNHITGDVHFLSYLLDKPRTILTVLDCGILHRTDGIRREVLRQLWFNLPVKRVAAITVISEATKRDLLQQIDCDPEMITVIPVFISPKFAPEPKPFNAERPTLLQVGTAPNKNIERLAAALTGLPCRLQIIGELSPEQKAALEDNRIDYTTSVQLTDDQVRAKYAEADVVMFASTVEGFGMPIVEANAVGRPVVTGNTSSMPEVAGKAACLVDPYDPASIREGYLRVVRDADYRVQLIENGYQNWKRFRAPEIASAYYSLYQRIITGSAASRSG